MEKPTQNSSANGSASSSPTNKDNGYKGPMKQRSLLFLDLETSGLNPGPHEITEIGALLVSQPNFEVIKTYEAKVLPTHLETATPEALDIGHFNKEVWEREGRPLRQALEELSALGQGAVLAGFNVTFDWAFLQAAFNLCDMPDPFYYHRYDVMSAAFSMLYNRPEMRKFSLSECCRFFGVNNRNAHTALADAEATYQVFLGLMKLEAGNKTTGQA
ncbi:MAG TPA: 3'-5' exonuclease [Chloroflexia bacterium]|nr:3'-5' exonuclease [Chloroflexia bacterium]